MTALIIFIGSILILTLGCIVLVYKLAGMICKTIVEIFRRK